MCVAWRSKKLHGFSSEGSRRALIIVEVVKNRTAFMGKECRQRTKWQLMIDSYEMSVVREQETGGVSNWQVSVPSNLNGELGSRWMEIWGEEQRPGRHSCLGTQSHFPHFCELFLWSLSLPPTNPRLLSSAPECGLHSSWLWNVLSPCL